MLTLPHRNLHANVSPEERLERLMMFLEAQFGADNVSPIAEPKLPPLTPPHSPPSAKQQQQQHVKDGSPGAGGTGDDDGGAAMDVSDDDDEQGPSSAAEEEEAQERRRREAELARLHRLGIPVPGVFIKVDKMEASVWLEQLEVESKNKVFADRVRAVVERAVEVTAPLWG
jgi:cleavage and polyadenylation specificity factor subunit 3